MSPYKMRPNTLANRLGTLANWMLAKRLVSETTCYQSGRHCQKSWGGEGGIRVLKRMIRFVHMLTMVYVKIN